MDGLRQDIRFSLRTLGKSRAHTVVVLLSLALGIGANSAVFSLVDALLLKKLPVADPDTLVQLVRNTPTAMGQEITFSYPQVERFRAGGALADVFAMAGARFSASAAGETEVLTGVMVTGNYFPVLGVVPEAGRALLPDDDRTGAAPVAVVSHAYWARRLNSDPGAVGRSLALNGIDFTVVGVAPASFFGVSPGSSPDIWVPLHLQPRLSAARPWLDDIWAMRLATMGRLKPGTGRDAAQAKLAVVFENIKAELLPGADPEERRAIAESALALVPGGTGYSWMRRWISKSVLMLMGVVGLVLLMACANVAGLVLARGAGRRQELAVRVALGAGRGRLVRQLFTESMILALGGGLLGLVVGQWTRSVLVRWFPSGPFHQLFSLSADHKVLLFTFAASLLTGIVFGLAPAISATRFDVNSALKAGGGRGATLRPGLGKVLVTAQVALSVVLLLAANLLIHSLANLENLDLGFDAEHLLVLTLDPGIAGYRGTPLTAFNQQLRQQLAALPGVQAASATRTVPGDGLSWPEAFAMNGEAADSEARIVMRNWIGPDYFRTMSTPVLLGREFSERDDAQAPRVAIVNEALVRRYFAGRNPIGQPIRLRRQPGVTLEIVGMVRNTIYDSVWNETPPLVLTPYAQADPAVMSFLVRTGDPAALAGVVRTTVKTVGQNVPVIEVVPYPQLVYTTLSRNRLMATVLGFFSFLGLLLVAVGLYALMANAVASRVREIGIRMALGAARRTIVEMVLREALLLVGIGMAISVPLVYFGSRLLQTYLFHMTAHDPLTLLLTLGLMLAVATVAVCVPALRASRVDPIAALRCE